MIGHTISHYRILNKLGEGGMGVVYVAEDILLERRVAIKTLNVEPEKQHYRQRFLREARAVSALHHPNIAVVHDYGETPDGKPFIVMELVEGETLAELLSQGGLTLSRVLDIIGEVAKALAEAHRLGIIHRDIKPSNVIVNKRGEVKVLDFGLAKNVSDGTEEDAQSKAFLATQTREGVIVGTPMYLSPEQALGLPVDARSDLFSVGSLLYECLTGRPAFMGSSAVEICAKVIRDDPPPLVSLNQHIPPELNRITLKALAKKPEGRYQSADELLRDLRACRDARQDMSQIRLRRASVDVSALIPSARTTIADGLRRPKVLAAVFLLAMGAALLAAWGISAWRGGVHRQLPPSALREFEEGTNALRSGLYYTAIKKLEAINRETGGFALAHARLAEAWTELDYGDRAEDELRRAHALSTGSRSRASTGNLPLQASISMASKNFSEAVEAYEKLAEHDADEEKVNVYLDLARAHEKSGNVGEAVEAYQKAISLKPEHPTAHLRLGILYGRQQNRANAAESFGKAEAVYRASKDFEGVTEVLYRHGSVFNRSEMTTEARDKLQQALDLIQVTDNTYQKVRILLSLAGVSYTETNPSRAKQYLSEALALAQSNDYDSLVTEAFIELGNASLANREKAEAEEFYKRALDAARNHKGARGEARARLSLASLYEQQDRADEALSTVEPAIEFYRAGDDGGAYSQALLLHGRLKLQKGDAAAAQQSFNQVVELAKRTDDHSQAARVHFNVGYLFTARELYTDALRHYDESCALSKTLGEQVTTGYCLLYRADVQGRLGLYEEADATLREASAVVALLDNRYKKLLTARRDLIEARVLLSRLDFDKALVKGRDSLSLLGAQDKYASVEAACVLGIAQFWLGQRKAGRKSCEEAAARASQLSDGHLRPTVALALAEAALESGDSPGALEYAQRALDEFARSGRYDSAWRARLVAALAARSSGDESAARNFSAEARKSLAQFAARLEPVHHDRYLNRPDIKRYLARLERDFGDI